MTVTCSPASREIARTLPLREPVAVDALMEGLPHRCRRWGGLDRCECSGCAKHVVSRDEWLAWFIRQAAVVCSSCRDARYAMARDGNTYLVCETCSVLWS